MKNSLRILALSAASIATFSSSVSSAASLACERHFGRKVEAAKPAEAPKKAETPASDRLSATDVEILSNATKTIYSSFDIFRFQNFIRKAAPELAFEINWNRPFEKIVGDFFMRLSRRSDFESVTRELAANYRAEFSGREESAKVAMDALVKLRSRAVTIKKESQTGVTIETQTPENRELLNQVVAALTHSYGSRSDFELQRLLDMERSDIAKIDWNRSGRDNVVQIVNWMLASKNFGAIANKMIEKYKVDRSGKYPREAEMFARFASIQPRSGPIPIRPTVEIASQSAENRAIITEAIEVLNRSFDVNQFQSLMSYKVYDSNGNGLRDLVNWSGPREMVYQDVMRVMLNHPEFPELATKLSEAYRAERSGRNESDKIAIDKIRTITPKLALPEKPGPKRVVVLSKAEWTDVRSAVDILAVWSAKGIEARRGNLLEEMVVYSVPSLGGKIDFGGPTRKISTEIFDQLLLSETYSRDANSMAGYLRRNYPGNAELMSVAQTLESLRPSHRTTAP